MFAMFTQFFSAITVLFSAMEKGSKAIDHLAGWSEETAGAFADEAKAQRQAKLNQLNKDLKLTAAK